LLNKVNLSLQHWIKFAAVLNPAIADFAARRGKANN
jgi:hypothetical protein